MSSSQTARATAQERDRKRTELWATNLETWARGPVNPDGALDSSLKRNTAFIKRIKQGLGAENRDAALKDIASLNLEKYIEEIVQSVPEGLSRCSSAKDHIAAAEVLTALHRRTGPVAFAVPLTEQLAAQLKPTPKAASQAASTSEQKERDEAARVQRQRLLLRVVAELAIVQLLGPADKHRDAHASITWLHNILKDLLSSDREHANIPILITLLKGLGATLLPDAQQEDPKPQQEPDDSSKDMILRSQRASFYRLFKIYYDTLARRVVLEHTRIQEQDRRNHEAYIKSGIMFEDRQQHFEKTTKSYEKMLESTRQLAELLGLPMPKLEDSVQSSSIGLNLDAKSAFERDDEDYSSGRLPWEDEDTKRFYEDIPDLKDLVPMDLLSAGANAALNAKYSQTGWQQTEADAENGNTTVDALKASDDTNIAADSDADVDDGSRTPQAVNGSLTPVLHPTDSPGDSKDVPPVPTSTDLSHQDATSATAKLSILLMRLPELTSRDAIDSAAVEFGFLNSKASRGRLVKTLIAIPRHRSDLAPYWARFIAILNQHMPDVGGTVVAALDEDFRYLHRKRFPELTERRARNAQYLGELTKFKVTPIHVIFHCLKICLDDFSSWSLETLSILLETCGRFLLRTDKTSDRMKGTLELLRRKRAASHIDQRLLLMLDNAYYFCNPPQRKAVAQKYRPPIELYIRHLFYNVLTRRTLSKTLKLFRKMAWDDPAVRKYLFKGFTKPWRVKFGNVWLLAILLFELRPYHPDFVLEVLEQVCEDIVQGLETNIFQFNQRRVALCRYLGELYNYRLVNSKLIFDQLWAFVTFGHPYGRPWPGQSSPPDAADDYFRIRLICTLLDTCGSCFGHGSLKKRLDSFLTFLNLYVLSKTQPVPMEVDFMLTDTLEALRPGLTFTHSLEEAALAVETMFAQPEAQVAETEQPQSASIANDVPSDASSGSDEEDDDEEDQNSSSSESDEHSDSEEDDGDTSDEDQDQEVDEDADQDDIEEQHDTDDEEDDEVALERERQAEIARRADEDFDRELAKMIASSSPSTASGGANPIRQRNLLGAGLPLLQRGPSTPFGRSVAQPATTTSSTEDGKHPADSDGHMTFSLLTKKGSKSARTEINIPLNASIAIQTRTKQLRDEAERKQLKELVLAYGRREDADEQHGHESHPWTRRRPRE